MNTKRKVIIPVFVPHLGCPNDCVFCNQRKITGRTSKATVKDLQDAVNARLSTIHPDEDEIEIAFFGGSFTMIPIADQVAFLEAGRSYVESGLVKSLRLSTRPDGVSPEVIERLKYFGVRTVELGVQSLVNRVLESTKRGHRGEDVEIAIQKLKQNDFVVGVQLMIGLPESQPEDEIETARRLVHMAPAFARIYPTLVIRETELDEMYSRGEYKPLTVTEAVERSGRVLEIFQEANIPVIRIGLQPTTEISEGSEVVAGPFHPAFGELVESNVIFRAITSALMESQIELEESEEVLLHCNPRKISKIIGQKKWNILEWNKRLSPGRIRVVGDAMGEEISIEFPKTRNKDEIVIKC